MRTMGSRPTGHGTCTGSCWVAGRQQPGQEEGIDWKGSTRTQAEVDSGGDPGGAISRRPFEDRRPSQVGRRDEGLVRRRRTGAVGDVSCSLCILAAWWTMEYVFARKITRGKDRLSALFTFPRNRSDLLQEPADIPSGIRRHSSRTPPTFLQDSADQNVPRRLLRAHDPAPATQHGPRSARRAANCVRTMRISLAEAAAM